MIVLQEKWPAKWAGTMKASFASREAGDFASKCEAGKGQESGIRNRNGTQNVEDENYELTCFATNN